MQTKLLRWVIYSRIDFNLISVAFQVQRHFDAAAKDKSKGGLDEKDETRGVIGDIIYYFTLMSNVFKIDIDL